MRSHGEGWQTDKSGTFPPHSPTSCTLNLLLSVPTYITGVVRLICCFMRNKKGHSKCNEVALYVNMAVSLCLQCMSFCNVFAACLILCFYASTICVCLCSWYIISSSPLCSKPQEVKTSMVETPPLMRATVSQTSTISNQPGKERFSQLRPRENRLIQNQDSSLFSHDTKALRKDRLFWSQSRDLFTEDPHLYINTQHLFPERQTRADQPAKLCLKLRKASHDSVDAGIKPYQVDPDWSCQLQTSPDCSPKQNNILYTQRRDTVDVRNNDQIYIER